MIRAFLAIVFIVFIIGALRDPDSDESILHALLFSEDTEEYYAHSVINVRDGPSTQDEVIHQLVAGESVSVESDSDGWAAIEINGKQGYVYLPVFQKEPYEEPCHFRDECWRLSEEGRTVIRECQRAIERQAQYSYEWTDGFSSRRFSRRAYDEENQEILLLGDEIELTNAFGAPQRHSYACRYSTRDNAVIGAPVEPGRL